MKSIYLDKAFLLQIYCIWVRLVFWYFCRVLLYPAYLLIKFKMKFFVTRSYVTMWEIISKYVLYLHIIFDLSFIYLICCFFLSSVSWGIKSRTFLNAVVWIILSEFDYLLKNQKIFFVTFGWTLSLKLNQKFRMAFIFLWFRQISLGCRKNNKKVKMID